MQELIVLFFWTVFNVMYGCREAVTVRCHSERELKK